MKKTTPSTIPLIIDTNAFGYLSDKSSDELLQKGLEKNNNPFAQRLYVALKIRNIIHHETSILENLGFAQIDIHKRLKPIIINSAEEVKNIFHPHFKVYQKSRKGDEDIKALGDGFSKAMMKLFVTGFNHLLNDEILLSENEILNRLKYRQQVVCCPSKHFKSFCKYVTLNLKTKRKTLSKNLALESVCRYGKNLMQQIYSGNSEINDLWNHYITSNYFELWKQRDNINAYRMISEELQYINNKFKTEFFPADVLRQHDDTVDGQIVHALSFGWYSYSTLRQIAVLTEDPLPKIIARVNQYRAFLAYCQNPLAPNNPNIISKISHILKPGVFYHLDREKHLVKCVEFEPGIAVKNGDHMQIQVTHSDVQTLPF